jgi:hypothetical protein
MSSAFSFVADNSPSRPSIVALKTSTSFLVAVLQKSMGAETTHEKKRGCIFLAIIPSISHMLVRLHRFELSFGSRGGQRHLMTRADVSLLPSFL